MLAIRAVVLLSAICRATAASPLDFLWHAHATDHVNATAVAKEPTVAPGVPPRDVAIIGAGAGGSSAAFWLHKAQERLGLDISVDIYDKESYIGGRSTTVYPYNDTSMKPVELGASIFVSANKNMWRATEEFNLSRISFEDDDDMTGFWDGEKFLMTVGGTGLWTWWTTAKMVWRYGWDAPIKVRSIVQNMVDAFLDLYAPDSPKWDNIPSLSTQLAWTGLTALSAANYLDLHEVRRSFSREVVEAATRVNYGQNVDQIHMLEGACSLAASGATSVEGGNWQVFQEFVKRSGAAVHLNTSITSITRSTTSPPTYTLHTADGHAATYKAVILAAPYHASGIEITPALTTPVPHQPYVHLHVTLLTTTLEHPNPVYFGLPSSAKTPRAVFTTWEGVRRGGKAPEFNSLSYHGLVNGADGPKEWVVKIFSEKRIEDQWLQEMFAGQVGWVYRKEWDAYPKLPPTTEFPPVKLDEAMYYVNSFEPFISTMETETISSRNIVDLLLQEHHASGLCGAPLHTVPEQSQVFYTDAHRRSMRPPAFVLGWDCTLDAPRE